MAELPPDAHAGDDADEDTGRASTAGMPRWVKVSLIVALALVAVAIAVLLVGGGAHDPGGHDGAGDIRAAVVEEGGGTVPRFTVPREPAQR